VFGLFCTVAIPVSVSSRKLSPGVASVCLGILISLWIFHWIANILQESSYDGSVIPLLAAAFFAFALLYVFGATAHCYATTLRPELDDLRKRYGPHAMKQYATVITCLTTSCAILFAICAPVFRGEAVASDTIDAVICQHKDRDVFYCRNKSPAQEMGYRQDGFDSLTLAGKFSYRRECHSFMDKLADFGSDHNSEYHVVINGSAKKGQYATTAELNAACDNAPRPIHYNVLIPEQSD
jgi:hypothetical protein